MIDIKFLYISLVTQSSPFYYCVHYYYNSKKPLENFTEQTNQNKKKLKILMEKLKEYEKIWKITITFPR